MAKAIEAKRLSAIRKAEPVPLTVQTIRLTIDRLENRVYV